MVRSLLLLLLLALAGCGTSQRPPPDTSSPCAVSEGSYACQVERYRNIGM
jgi:hypothetical protein